MKCVIENYALLKYIPFKDLFDWVRYIFIKIAVSWKILKQKIHFDWASKLEYPSTLKTLQFRNSLVQFWRLTIMKMNDAFDFRDIVSFCFVVDSHPCLHLFRFERLRLCWCKVRQLSGGGAEVCLRWYCALIETLSQRWHYCEFFCFVLDWRYFCFEI